MPLRFSPSPTEKTEEAVKVTRWTRRLLFGAVAVLVPALAGCEAGLDAPTQDFHPAALGQSTVSGDVTVDDAFVLGPALGGQLQTGGQAGVFLALYATGNDVLQSVAAPGTAASVRLIGGPVNLAPNSLVQLNGQVPKIVLTNLTTALSGGDTVELQLTFQNAGEVTLQVPVEPDAYDYATYSPPPPAPTPTPTAKHHVKPRPGASGTASPTATPSPSPTS
jgi:copper(I)-binding protein